MNNRGKGSRGRNWRSDERNEHGDRGSVRHVRFKLAANTKKRQGSQTWPTHGWYQKWKLLKDEVDMLATTHEQRENLRGGSHGLGGRLVSPGPRAHQHGPRKFMLGPSPWYQIIIPYGSKHDKEVVMNALESNLEPEDGFIPISFKFNGNAAVLYVDDPKVAEKLFNADRKVMLPDGYRMMLRVRNLTPTVEVTDGLKDRMTTVMGKRYNPATKALDLTRFHVDEDIREMLCPLTRLNVLLAVMNIIVENVPDLEALNLNENHLMTLDHLKLVLPKLKHIKILYLAENRIPYLNTLMPLKVLPLVELNVKGNPLVSKFDEHDVYVSNVRKHFPRLKRLDEEELPPMIGFEVAEDVTLPPRQPSFLVDVQGADVVRQFLLQYYSIYDSESRQPLLAAYHENATMSLCASYTHSDCISVPSDRLHSYMGQNNRNIIRTTEREARRRGLRAGRLQVVSFLAELPATQHDLVGTSVDLMVYTPGLMVLTINGVFRETSSPLTPKPLRSFHRTLTIVPENGGYCIRNDMLFVTNATKDQVEKAFQDTAPVAAPAPAPTTVAAPAAAGPASDDAVMMQLVTSFAQQSGMNAYWSTECLQSSSWDYQRAFAVFGQLYGQRKIPPEAFIRST